MHPLLKQAKGPWGEQRFFEIGRHPASYRSRQMLQKLEEAGLEHTDAADYCRQQIRQVEDGELRAQREYLLRLGADNVTELPPAFHVPLHVPLTRQMPGNEGDSGQ